MRGILLTMRSIFSLTFSYNAGLTLATILLEFIYLEVIYKPVLSGSVFFAMRTNAFF